MAAQQPSAQLIPSPAGPLLLPWARASTSLLGCWPSSPGAGAQQPWRGIHFSRAAEAPPMVPKTPMSALYSLCSAPFLPTGSLFLLPYFFLKPAGHSLCCPGRRRASLAPALPWSDRPLARAGSSPSPMAGLLCTATTTTPAASSCRCPEAATSPSPKLLLPWPILPYAQLFDPKTAALHRAPLPRTAPCRLHRTTPSLASFRCAQGARRSVQQPRRLRTLPA
jgi:hypothetical protein